MSTSKRENPLSVVVIIFHFALEHFRSDDIKEKMDDLETQWVELKVSKITYISKPKTQGCMCRTFNTFLSG